MESRGPETRELRVGEWWVRPRQNEVENGETCVHLEARSIEVLLCLARHAPAVVSKETILDEVWADVAVGDEVISHAIWELRKAFGDNARRPDYIRTIPKKGYALVAEVFWSVLGVEPQVGTAVGPYRLEEEIGRGAMGVVYRATDTRLDRTVALKFLAAELTRDAEAVRRFEREARLAASLDHPNLAPVYEVGEMSGGRQFLVTAYCSGGTLRDRLKEGVLAPREALEIVQQIARGLAVAHKKDIIHRDVKPANILFNEDGTARLVDFGIAKLASSTSLTRTGHSLGTPAYKSPEQSRGHETDHRTDLWSLGVVLYECLTAKRPFSGSYDHAVVRSILEDEPDLTLSLPADQSLPGLEGVLRKALSKDPSERFQSAGELVAAVEECLGLTTEEPTSRRPFRWAFALISLAVLVSVAWAVSRRGDLPDETLKSRDNLAGVTEYDYFEANKALKFGWSVLLKNGSSESYLEARSLFLLATENDPKNRRAVCSLAYTYSFPMGATKDQREEDYRTALSWVGKSSRPDSEYGLCWVVRARIEWLRGLNEGLSTKDLFASGRLKEALQYLETAARTFHPRQEESDLALITHGRILELAGLREEAIAKYQQATRSGEGPIRANLRLAQTYEVSGDLPEAEAAYGKVIEHAPDHVQALERLGILSLQRGDWTQAARHLRKANEIETDADILHNLGVAYYYYYPPERAKAEGFFRRALELDADHRSANEGLGDCLWLDGNLDESAVYWKRALELFMIPSSVVETARLDRAQVAVLKAKLGDCDGALGVDEVVEEEFVVYSKLLFQRTLVHARCGDREEAVRAFRQAVESGLSSRRFWDEPFLKEMQDDPGFRAVYEGLPSADQ